MITKFNSTPVSSSNTDNTKSLSGSGTFFVLALLAVAAYFGYKEYEKYKEKQE